jgi:hypothetical protein
VFAGIHMRDAVVVIFLAFAFIFLFLLVEAVLGFILGGLLGWLLEVGLADAVGLHID